MSSSARGESVDDAMPLLDHETQVVEMLAAIVGDRGKHAAPVTFVTLFVGLLFPGDPASRWLQARLSDEQRARVYVDAGISQEFIAEMDKEWPWMKRRPTASDRSVSAVRMLQNAKLFLEPGQVVGTRHLIAAYLCSVPDDHRHHVERWDVSSLVMKAEFARFARQVWPEERAWERLNVEFHNLDDGDAAEDAARDTAVLGPLLSTLKVELSGGGVAVLARAGELAAARSDRGTIVSRDLLTAIISLNGRLDESGVSQAFGEALREFAGASYREIQEQVAQLQAADGSRNVPFDAHLTAGAEAVLRAAAHAERSAFGFESLLGRHGLIVALLTLDRVGATKGWRSVAPQVRNRFLERAANTLPEHVLEDFRKALDVSANAGPERAADGFEPTYSNDSPLGDDNVLGTENEATAFARLIASQKVKPPLSIGVFGDWGSGKSFFMNRIATHVTALAKQPLGKAEGQEPRGRIIQIRFNAWHYIESNLWASLVEYIFTELEEGLCAPEDPSSAGRTLLERLSTAQQLKLDAAEALAVARAHSTQAATDLAQARRSLESVKVRERTTRELARAAWDAVWSSRTTEEVQVHNKAVKDLGLADLSQSVEGLRGAVSLARKEAGRSAIYGRALIVRFGTKGGVTLVLVALALLPLLMWLLGPHADKPAILDGLHRFVVAGTATIASLTAYVGWGTRQVTRALGVLDQIGERVDRAEVREQEAQRGEVEEAAQRAAELRAGVDSAELRLKEAAKREEEAAREFSEGTARGRLSRFIRERVAKGDYAKHLGVVASVRKDFGELSELMLAAELDLVLQEERDRIKAQYQRRLEHIKSAYAEQLKNEMGELEEMASGAAEQTQRLERIVLYIDDLDRCPAEKVIEVLQAVHLLLCFPLFVVVVAVDARWLARSLEERYPHLLSEAVGPRVDARPRPNGAARADVRQQKNAPVDDEAHDGRPELQRDSGKARPTAASPHDYLEKIFQLAYWVRPMDGPISSRYVRYRLAGDIELSPAATPDRSETSPSSGPKGTKETAGADTESETPSPAASGGSPGASKAADDNAAAQTQGGVPPAPLMRLSEDEARLMEQLAPFLGGSPRRGLRFVNTYRVVKSGLRIPEGQSHPFRSVYIPLLTQLAVVCGAPRSARRLFSILSRTSDGSTVGDFVSLARADEELVGDWEWADISGILLVVEGELGKDAPVGPLRDAATIAQRYGFVNCR